MMGLLIGLLASTVFILGKGKEQVKFRNKDGESKKRDKERERKRTQENGMEEETNSQNLLNYDSYSAF